MNTCRMPGLILVVSACVLVGLLAPGQSLARVVCIRLTSDRVADTTDLARFRQFHTWKDKTGNDLAVAIWRYLCDYETGLYHFNEILEGPDPFDEYATVRDPLKILNTYNMAYCGIFGPVLDGIFHGVGFSQGRAFGLEAWNHCATEVWYDDSWHYLDIDVRGLLLRPDGVVASLAEAKRDRSLWVDPAVSIEPFFPNEPDKAKVFDIYRDSRVNYYYRWFEMGHTMDFYLRRGESFTRFWQPQGERWHHLARYAQTKWIRELIEQPPRGPKPNHRDFTRWNHGNGLYEYSPTLTNAYSDFEDGYFDVKNLRPGRDGLEIIRDGDAEVTFEVFTPYIIVPKINDLDDSEDDGEASVVTLKGKLPIKVLVSPDHGLSWKAFGGVGSDRPAIIDLTSIAGGTYGYLLKLKTAGLAGSTAITSLNIRTWVQVAPISLPTLRKGRTTFRCESGDRYGRQTTAMLVNPNTADPNDLTRYVLQMPAHYDPKRHTCRIRGEVIVCLAAPPQARISWLTVGGTFRTDQGEQARNTDNRIAYAIGRPEGFQEIYRSHVPTWVNHWRYNWDGDVVLTKPAEVVYVKYTANTGLNTIRACLHLTSKKAGQDEVKVVHEYRVNGQIKKLEKWVDAGDSYTVDCDAEPENISVTLAVPSQLTIGN
jgi:hypothetical protein